MAQLKDLIVQGVTRVLGKIYAPEFVGKLTGNADTATKATQDSAGQQINTTYIKGLSASGRTITYTKGNGNTATITTQDTTYGNATTSASGLMSNTDKSKLDGIATGANKYTHPTYTSRAAGFYKVTVDGSGHVSNATAVTKADITGLGIPSTNTTYSAFTKATADAAGGSGLVPAPTKGQQGLYLRGDGTWATPTNTTYGAATTSANGLMTSAMVTKLNGIATGANAYTHPSYTAKSSGLYKVTVDSTGHVSATTAVTKADITALGIPGSDTNTDTKVTQTAVDNSTYSNWRTVIWGASSNATEGFSPATVTDGVFSDKNLTYQPSTGTLRATTFKGNLAWSNITGKPSTFTPASHTHTKSQITDFPSSLPASDVYSWAKASSKPSYSWSEITSKPSSFTPASHTHYSLTTIGDQRATATTPNSYSNALVFQGLKNSDKIGSPSTNTYSYLVGLRGWKDSSGGNAHELAFNDSGIFRRSGASTAWGSWAKILDSSNYTDYAAAKSHKQAYTAGECTSYDSDSNTMGVTPAAVKKAIGLFDPKAHTHAYLPLSGGTLTGSSQTPLYINGASNNEASIGYFYNGDSTKRWVVGPGAGSGNMDYFGFYREGVGRMTCISSSGNIDTNGYMQAAGLINTYTEYQSCKGGGSRDWRFGSATGSGDQNWFGFYDYSSGYHGGIYGPEHILRMNGEIQANSPNAFRALCGNYGWIIRNDGINVYLMPTNSGDPYGSWANNWSRFDLATGEMFIRNASADGGGVCPPILTNASTDRIYSITKNNDTSMKVHVINGSSYVTKYVSYANSDIRLKENISDTSISNALSTINKMRLHQFDWKSSKEHQDIGFIADELEQLDSKFSIGGGWDDEEHKNMNAKSVDTFYMLGYVIKGMQELSAQVTSLKEENKSLKEKLNM